MKQPRVDYTGRCLSPYGFPAMLGLKWTVPAGGSYHGAPCFIEGDRIVTAEVPTTVVAGTKITCLSRINGNKNWDFEIPIGDLRTGPAWPLGIHNGIVYCTRGNNNATPLTSWSGPIYGLDITDGSLLWTSTALITLWGYFANQYSGLDYPPVIIDKNGDIIGLRDPDPHGGVEVNSYINKTEGTTGAQLWEIRVAGDPPTMEPHPACASQYRALSLDSLDRIFLGGSDYTVIINPDGSLPLNFMCWYRGAGQGDFASCYAKNYDRFIMQFPNSWAGSIYDVFTAGPFPSPGLVHTTVGELIGKGTTRSEFPNQNVYDECLVADRYLSRLQWLNIDMQQIAIGPYLDLEPAPSLSILHDSAGQTLITDRRWDMGRMALYFKRRGEHCLNPPIWQVPLARNRFTFPALTAQGEVVVNNASTVSLYSAGGAGRPPRPPGEVDA